MHDSHEDAALHMTIRLCALCCITTHPLSAIVPATSLVVEQPLALAPLPCHSSRHAPNCSTPHHTTPPLHSAPQYLLRICCDVAAEGCPRPDPTTQAGTATLRRMMAAGGGAGPSSTDDGISSVGGGHEDEDEASHYSSLPLSRHRQDAEEVGELPPGVRDRVAA